MLLTDVIFPQYWECQISGGILGHSSETSFFTDSCSILPMWFRLLLCKNVLNTLLSICKQSHLFRQYFCVITYSCSPTSSYFWLCALLSGSYSHSGGKVYTKYARPHLSGRNLSLSHLTKECTPMWHPVSAATVFLVTIFLHFYL